MAIDSSKFGKAQIGDIPNYGSDGIDVRSCKDPKCKYCDNLGNCSFETCLWEEIPTIHEQGTYDCIICKKPYDKPPAHEKLYMCPDCLRRLEDLILNNDTFTCGLCGGSQKGNRLIPAANICNSCVAKLKIEVSAKDNP